MAFHSHRYKKLMYFFMHLSDVMRVSLHLQRAHDVRINWISILTHSYCALQGRKWWSKSEIAVLQKEKIVLMFFKVSPATNLTPAVCCIVVAVSDTLIYSNCGLEQSLFQLHLIYTEFKQFQTCVQILSRVLKSDFKKKFLSPVD